MIRLLHIDIETYSATSIAYGIYKYAEDEAFKVLLLAYAFGDDPVRVVDLAQGEELPSEVKEALTSDKVIKVAHNYTFERVCLGRMLGLTLKPEQWQCTMAMCQRCGYPAPLAEAADVLEITEGKMPEGKELLRLFCVPNKAGRRTMPVEASDKWQTFKEYCQRDVEVERNIYRTLCNWVPTETEEKVRCLDARINDRGVMIDRLFAQAAAHMADETAAEEVARLREITGLVNPNSTSQLKAWISSRVGRDVSQVNKTNVAKMLADNVPDDVREALMLRQSLGKTSTVKYQTMLDCVCGDGRLHGMLRYHGARTGRWTGQLVQLQNLPQNHIDDLDEARHLVDLGDKAELQARYGMPARDILSQLIRTCFVAAPGYALQVCDFSAIEARVIAWLAGEQWVLDVFEEGSDIYCETASKMFGVPVEKHGQNAELRQKGKISVLALGFGGGVGALKSMGGERLGLTEEEMLADVAAWRRANSRIVRLWRDLEYKCREAVRCPGEDVLLGTLLSFRMVGDILAVKLPSGRRLCYPGFGIDIDGAGRFEGDGKEVLAYDCVNQTTRKWERIRTYGGKICENIVQAIARDVLAEVMLRCWRRDIRIVFHVHDELVCEVPTFSPLERLTELFDYPPEWAEGLPLKGAGYETQYYYKD